MNIISKQQIQNRKRWVKEISHLSDSFSGDSARVEALLSQEINDQGIASLLGHLRLCGAIPEGYKHDSSEEKLYSKYIDIVIHEAFKKMGFTFSYQPNLSSSCS